MATALSAQCGTTVVTPAVNTTWTQAGSPYCVNATISVVNLTIQAGVEVRMAPGVTLQVGSWLRALGTRTQPVVFRAQNLTAGRWGGIEFVGPVPPNNASTLDYCVVTEANDSGIRILDNDQVTLQGCLIRDNTSPVNGGGIRVVLTSGTVGFFDCDIESNRAARNGGGIHSTTSGAAALHLTTCRVRSNVANQANAVGTSEGGGISSSGNMSLMGCHVADNSVSTGPHCGGGSAIRGGGVHASNGTVQIANSLLMGNACTESSFCSPVGSAHGGGLFAAATLTSLVLDNCIVGCNAATASQGGAFQQGSGMHSAASSTVITNCTIARNSNEGLRVAAGSTTLTNCIVYANSGPSIVGTATANYSCIQGGFAGGTGNFGFNPQFTTIGTGCQPENFAISPFSPCIDAGDANTTHNDACRPPGQGTARNDMGALGGSSNCGFTGPSVVICGAQTYGTGKQVPDAMTLDWTFTSNQAPYPGNLTIANGFPSSPSLLLLGVQAADTPVSGITLLVNPASANPLAITLSSAGAWSVPLNLQIPFLVGFPLFVQAIALPVSGSVRASNGLRIATCH